MANFRMTGESFTRQARDLMISEDPARAWRFCAAGLDSGELGAAEAAARKILDGRSRLIGDGGDMMLVDEDPTDPETASYLAEVRYLYAGRVRVDGRWWRPRAQITDLGDEDNPIGWHRTASDGRRAITDWRRRRFEFYANPGERAFVVLGAYMARWAECPDGPGRYNGVRVDDFVLYYGFKPRREFGPYRTLAEAKKACLLFAAEFRAADIPHKWTWEGVGGVKEYYSRDHDFRIRTTIPV